MTNLGMIRIAAVSPELKIGNTEYNGEEILRCINEACQAKPGIIIFPALCITGASCGDLFFQDILYENQIMAINKILTKTENIGAAVILGMYLRTESTMIECAMLMQSGTIKGVIPKHNPSHFYGNFSNSRWFNPSPNDLDAIYILGQKIPFGKILFSDQENGLCLGVEVGDDTDAPISPGLELAAAGAQIILNPSANPELIGSSGSRQVKTSQKSRAGICAQVLCSAGASESTSAGIYSGHLIIAEDGEILNDDCRLDFKSKQILSDVDYQYLKAQRLRNPAFQNTKKLPEFQRVDLDTLPTIDEATALMRTYSKTPFIPSDRKVFEKNCKESFEIQSHALARRLLHTNSKKIVLGVSGGLDSTLALLVAARAVKILDRPSSDIISVTMPGFGTSGKTYLSAMNMMKALGTEIREINIKDAVLLHFQDIGHDPSIKNVVYENVQARERTQILMDIANMVGGISLGTGDLSEIALGWSTYNGDHMSMYNVNAGIPKTFMKAVIRWFIDYLSNGNNFSLNDDMLASALNDVLDTPVSPELLPPDESDAISQKTEDKIGPYALHDFFLYHTIKSGASPLKMMAIAKAAFYDEYDEDYISKWLKTFYIRFFTHQFKRGCAPDSPKVGSISLSHKGDWMMPSDGDVNIWIEKL